MPPYVTMLMSSIARAALFLHEVAHPGIIFSIDPAQGQFPMVCDRRQLGQALTNIVKNGVEAIETRRNRGEYSLAGDRVELRLQRKDDQLIVDVMDTGIGLPEERIALPPPIVPTKYTSPRHSTIGLRHSNRRVNGNEIQPAHPPRRISPRNRATTSSSENGLVT